MNIRCAILCGAMALCVVNSAQALELTEIDIVRAEKFCQSIFPPPKEMTIVKMEWPPFPGGDELVDIDLWMREPDGTLVGFMNINGHAFHLTGDGYSGRMARENGVQKKNHSELMVACQPIPEGIYLVNVHAYRVGSYDKDTFELPVTVSLWNDNSFVFAVTVVLGYMWEEMSVLTFRSESAGITVKMCQTTSNLIGTRKHGDFVQPLCP